MAKRVKILLTGGTGFIGGYLKDRLKDDFEIVDLKNDLKNYEQIGKELITVNPDIIIHLAARTEVEKSFYDPIDFSVINYCGTVNLIEKAKDLSNLKLFLFSSTMETYGWQPKPWKAFDEETIQHPNAPYAVAKLGCEKYLEYAGRAYNFPYTILRQTNTYGRWDNDFFVVEQIITQMLKNKDGVKLGYKEPYRNFLFIDDLIDLYEVIVNNPTKGLGEIFCVGPENALTIGALTYIIAKKLNWNGRVLWDTKPKRPGEIYYLNSTNKKVTRILGWQPKTNLSDGLDKTIEMWRNKSGSLNLL